MYVDKPAVRVVGTLHLSDIPCNAACNQFIAIILFVIGKIRYVIGVTLFYEGTGFQGRQNHALVDTFEKEIINFNTKLSRKTSYC